MIRLSVVVPTYNRRHVLERTLPALFAQDLPPEEYEIIVVMDGSTDGTAEFLRGLTPKCALRVLTIQNSGAGAARNAGIRAAVGELVLFLDDDIIVGSDLFRQHCESHSGSDLRVVHGLGYIAPGSAHTIARYVTESFCQDHYDHLVPAMDLRFPDGLRFSLGVLTAMVNSSISRAVLLRSGGFDERIRAAEDLELGLRLWKMGLSFTYQPAAVAYEFYVKSSWQFLMKQARALGAGDLLAGRKHPEYRPHSRLSAFAETRVPKKWLRSALMRMPVSPVPLMALPLACERWFYRFRPMRKMAARLLASAEIVARLRGALSTAGSWKEFQSEFARRAPGLMYHRVGFDSPGNFRMTVSPEQFEQQMGWLADHGYVGIRPSDWLRWIREGTGLPGKPILLTFDDAYADTAHHAFPVLRRYGFGAAVFVVTERVGRTNTWDEAQGRGTLQLMTAEEIQYWATQGFEFGAHSRSHADLTGLSEADCRAEIAGSKNDLAALLGLPIVSFCYPYGEYNDAVRDEVRSHFDLAFCGEEGMNYLRGDPLLLRRAYVSPDDSLTEFALSVRLGGLQRFRDLRARVGVRSRLRRAFRSPVVERK